MVRARARARARGRAVRTDELLKCRQGFGRHRGVQRRVEGGVFGCVFWAEGQTKTTCAAAPRSGFIRSWDAPVHHDNLTAGRQGLVVDLSTLTTTGAPPRGITNRSHPSGNVRKKSTNAGTVPIAHRIIKNHSSASEKRTHTICTNAGAVPIAHRIIKNHSSTSWETNVKAGVSAVAHASNYGASWHRPTQKTIRKPAPNSLAPSSPQKNATRKNNGPPCRHIQPGGS